MRFGIFGDIHGNFDALEVVLGELGKADVDGLVCLGDIVGYGAEPGRCIAKVRELGCLVLAGNHDHAAIDKLDVEFFNAFAKRAALWTREQLTGEEKQYLGSLGFVDHYEQFACVHGSLHGPELFNYIATIFDAELSFEALDKPVLFYGHTHIPLTFFDTTPMTYTMESEIRITSLYSGKDALDLSTMTWALTPRTLSLNVERNPDEMATMTSRVATPIATPKTAIDVICAMELDLRERRYRHPTNPT